MNKFLIVAALVVALSACAKKEVSSAEVAKTSDLDGQVYVNPNTKADVIFEDGEIFVQKWGEEKLRSGTYRIEGENLVIMPDGQNDVFLNKDGKGGWYSMSESGVRDLTFGPYSTEITAEKKQLLEGLQKGKEVAAAPRVSLDKYTPVATKEDLRYLVVSRRLNVTDEDLARYFIPGYEETSDAFAKRELLAGVPAIKTRLEKFRAAKDFVFTLDPVNTKENFSPTEPYNLYSPYDFETGSFRLTGMQCPSDGSSLGIQGANFFNYSFVGWPKENCLIKVDEAAAKVIESYRSKDPLSTNAKLYVRALELKREPNGSEHLELEAHRADVTVWERLYPGRNELGTFTILKN